MSSRSRIGRRVTVAVCERIAAPVLVGIVRPIILLPPAALTGWSPDEIEMVLLHELAHVRRWDNLVNLVQRLVESLLFFHPAVWLVSSWVRREREACCDAVVVGRTNRPHAYAEMLVALAAQMPRSVLFHPAASSRDGRRPACAVASAASWAWKTIRCSISGKSLGVVMSGLLLAATLVVLNLPTPGRAKEPTENDSQELPSTRRRSRSIVRAVVGYDLDFDSVFPDRPWTTYDAERLERYPTPDAWPNVLGHIDTDANSFEQVRDRPPRGYQGVAGGVAFLVPVDWSVGPKGIDYTTLLFLRGIAAEAHVVAESYTSFACLGSMAGDMLVQELRDRAGRRRSLRARSRPTRISTWW